MQFPVTPVHRPRFSPLRPAESRQNTLLGAGAHRIPLKPRPLLVWPRDGVKQFLERLEILPAAGGIERRFYKVIAGDDCRIHPPHRRSARRRVCRLIFETPAPSCSPTVIGAGGGKQCPNALIASRSGCGIAQPSEGRSEVGSVCGHPPQQIFGQSRIPLAFRKEPKLEAQACPECCLKLRIEGCKGFVCRRHAGLFAACIRRQDRQQCFS